MGANEKHEATYHGHMYTPSIRGLRAAATVGGVHLITPTQFERGVEKYLKEFLYESWQKGYNEGVSVERYGFSSQGNPYK